MKTNYYKQFVFEPGYGRLVTRFYQGECDYEYGKTAYVNGEFCTYYPATRTEYETFQREVDTFMREYWGKERIRWAFTRIFNPLGKAQLQLYPNRSQRKSRVDPMKIYEELV